MGPVGHSLSALAAAAGLPFALGALALRPAWRVGWRERLGAHPGAAPGGVWVHGASVGEIRAATGLLDALAAEGTRVAASTTTPTGRALLRETRPGVPCGLAPLDHPWCVRAALRRVDPAVLMLIETELWPAWIAAAHERGVAVVVASGRLSDRSFPRYRRLRPLLRGTLERLSAVGARSARDAERFVELGVPAARVEVTGDLKLEPPADAATLAPELSALLGDVPLWVAGSTHPGEDEAALGALAAAEAGGHPLALVLAPRHPEARAAAEAACRRAGRRIRRRSASGPGPLAPGEVLLLDTLGELASLYGRARLAFVGGSLVPVGGHNLLEPLQHGCPVLFGPHTDNAPEAAELVLASGAGERVRDAAALAERVAAGLATPDGLRERGERGRAALDAHRGARERTLRLLARVRDGGRSER